MPKERNPVKVIAAILAHVPADRAELRRLLEHIKYDAGFRPPEAQRLTWLRLMDVLSRSLTSPPTLDWEIAISDIVEGRTPVEDA